MRQNKKRTSYNNRTREAGNVFILILLGVFLFGALMYSFSRSADQGAGNLSKQQAKIAAQEILNYARLVEGAVDRVRRNGCSESEISFENDVVAGYTNPNAPTDKSCHIFDDVGGKINYDAPVTQWLDSSNGAEASYGNFYFVAENEISGLNISGSSKDDLLIQLNWIKQEICEELNYQIFNDKTITEDPSSFFQGVTTGKAIGSFDNNVGSINLTSYPIHEGKNTACFSSQTGGGFHFYHALLAR